jgi:hypothetical protein
MLNGAAVPSNQPDTSTIIVALVPPSNSNVVVYRPGFEPAVNLVVNRPTGIGAPKVFPITGVDGIFFDGSPEIFSGLWPLPVLRL